MKRTMQIVALWAVFCSAAGAQTILRHSGSNDPQNENWLIQDGQAVFGSPTNDAGTLAWLINDNGTGGNDRLAYKDNFTAATNYAKLRNQWNLIFTLNIRSAGDLIANPSTDDKLNVLLNLTNSTGNIRRYNFNIGRNGNDAAVDLGSGIKFYVTGAGSGFHTWQLTRTNAATDIAQLYVDNVFITNYAGFNDSGFPLLGWGTTSGAGLTSSEWSLVLLEVPEPSSLGLMGITAAIGLVIRERRR